MLTINSPFQTEAQKLYLVLKDQQGTIWVNWKRVSVMNHRDPEPLSMARITAKTDPKYLSSQGTIPKEIRRLF